MRIAVLGNPVGAGLRAPSVGSVVGMEDEFRVEVDLDDHEHGYSLGNGSGRSIWTTTPATGWRVASW